MRETQSTGRPARRTVRAHLGAPNGTSHRPGGPERADAACCPPSTRDASLRRNGKDVAANACAPRRELGRRRQGKPHGLRTRTAGGHQSPDADAAEDDGGNGGQRETGRLVARSCAQSRRGPLPERQLSRTPPPASGARRRCRSGVLSEAFSSTDAASAARDAERHRAAHRVAGSRCRICESVSETSSPSNARRPVSIS